MPTTPHDHIDNAPDIEDVYEDTQDAVVSYIQEQPITALIGAFIAGVIIGRLVL